MLLYLFVLIYSTSGPPIGPHLTVNQEKKRTPLFFNNKVWGQKLQAFLFQVDPPSYFFIISNVKSPLNILTLNP